MLILITLGVYQTKAQQQWQYSEYMNNNFLLNPAEGGTEKFTDIKLGYRTQWVGLEGAPTSMFVSAHHPINKNREDIDGVRELGHHGIGGYITRDQTGPITRSSLYGSYSYHLPLTIDLTLSFGAFLGLKEYRLDGSEVKFEGDQSDAVLNGNATNYLPDATLGFWLYGKSFYVGASTFQLLANKLDLSAVNNAQDEGSLSRHFFITGGYKVPVSEKVFLVPSFVVKYASPAPAQFDLNAKIRYEDLYWGGVSYRNKDAIVALAGVTLKKLWDIGYSYDFNTSGLSGFNSGSHEILIGYRVHHDHEPPPAQFW